MDLGLLKELKVGYIHSWHTCKYLLGNGEDEDLVVLGSFVLPFGLEP